MVNRQFDAEELRILLTATFKILDSAKPNNDPNSFNIELKFINLFIETLLDRILIDYKSLKHKTKQEQFEHLKTNFVRFKACMQMTVAASFQNSMERFSKMPIDYYCIIKPAQESKSKADH